MGLWKKIKKKTNKGDLMLVASKKLVESKYMPKSVQKYGKSIDKLNAVTKRTGEMFADKFVNKYKALATEQAKAYGGEMAAKYGSDYGQYQTAITGKKIKVSSVYSDYTAVTGKTPPLSVQKSPANGSSSGGLISGLISDILSIFGL